jgi:hypothetical protein
METIHVTSRQSIIGQFIKKANEKRSKALLTLYGIEFTLRTNERNNKIKTSN